MVIDRGPRNKSLIMLCANVMFSNLVAFRVITKLSLLLLNEKMIYYIFLIFLTDSNGILALRIRKF